MTQETDMATPFTSLEREPQPEVDAILSAAGGAHDSESLNNIERKLQLACRHIQTLKNAQQGINVLPLEILGHIFTFLDGLRHMEDVEDLHRASKEKSSMVLAITQVCWQWRSAAFSTPNLWNHIHIHHHRTPFTSLSLKLSGHLPLIVYYSDNKGYTGFEGSFDGLEAANTLAFLVEYFHPMCQPPFRCSGNFTYTAYCTEYTSFNLQYVSESRSLKQKCAGSPLLEELVIDRWVSASTVQRHSSPAYLDNPTVLSNIRTIALSCSGLFTSTLEEVPTFLSCIRIPDSASRLLVTTDGWRWQPPLHNLLNAGRLSPTAHRTIRKLQVVASKEVDQWQAFGLEGEVVTVTTSIEPDLLSEFFASGLLISWPAYLPLRHIAVSGPIRASILVPQMVNALGLAPNKQGSPFTQGDLPSPLLESLSFLYYDPELLPQSEEDEMQVDGTMIALLAEERARRGAPLRQVIVERCCEDHLEWLQTIVPSATMPPRLNKRQQRELEELQALGGKPEPAASDAESDKDEPVPAPKAGGFAALMAGNDEESEDDEIDQTKPSKSRKNKKKKKKATSETPKSGAAESPRPISTPKPTPAVPFSKKALKRAKAKEKKAADEELDQALAELSLKYQGSQNMNQKTVTGQTFADLLSVSVQHLDSDAEMRKFFGSKVVQANKDSSSSAGPSRRKTPAVRSHLTQPKPTWWAAKGREGLSIRALTEDELNAKLKRHGWQPMPQEKWWTVEYSKRYKSLTKVFMGTVYSGDPQGFWDLLGRSPWQADTLLQVSEVYRHREEYAQAFDFVDRALFTYERAFVGAFNFTSGQNRLDFDYVENRPFYLAVHRQVADLLRRGCVRTSFEFARLLYSLDPWSDPHGALLHLDFLAIKSGMHQWLIGVFGLFSEKKGDPQRMDPSLLPGWTYARALALRIVEDAEKSEHSKSTTALREALNDFPSVVPLLADKLDVAIPASIRSHIDFKIETGAVGLKPAYSAMHLLSHLYAQKSHVLWQDHSQWFLETVTSTFTHLPSRLAITDRRRDFLSLYSNPEPRYSAYRFLIVLETTHRNLFPFIDINLEQARGLMCDPLPPPTAVNKYDEEYFRNVDDLVSFQRRTRREQAMDQRRLAQMVPDANFRQQLELSHSGSLEESSSSLKP
ncbi:hypothetical protein NMY22_g3426 [Coprinellus aureogranulatus]|nr:hypothetical protein NMY22_g3426 [Coprinellus aureogranulatus]